MKTIRARAAIALLYVVKAIAPVTMHAEGVVRGRAVAMLGVGTEIGDVTGLVTESTMRLVAHSRATEERADDPWDDDEDEW